MDKWREVEQKLAGLINELRAAQWTTEWMHFSGDAAGAENKEFDDSGWKKIGIGWNIQWQASRAVAWFRRKTVIPKEIYGINLNGAKLEGMFYTPVGGEIFVDGKKVTETDWLPDINFPISNKLKGGEEFQITVKTKIGEGWGVAFFSRIFIDKVDEAIFQLELFLNLLRLTQALIRWKPANKKLYEEVFNEALEKIDLKMLEEKKVEKLLPSILQAQAVLSPISKEAKKLKIHLVGHAHIDMNWLWTWPSTLNTAKGTFTTVDKLMDEVPDFRFSQSQAGLYEGVEKSMPEIFEIIKKRVKENRWDLTASTWVEGDLNTASGEALVRQTLYGKKYIKEKFGKDARICWCPDTFGHPWTYPQILKKSGIDFYYGHRCRPQDEYPLFWWESPDGSRVLALLTGETYNNSIRPELCSALIYNKDRTGTNHYFVSYGVGDHGGGPTRRDVKRVKVLQNIKEFPQIVFDAADGYFKEVLKEKKNFPVVRRELNFTFEGCYSTHGDIKMYNRISENLLPTAESLNVMAGILGVEYPKAEVEKAWQSTLFSQFHDIYCGTAIHPSYGDGDHHAKEMFEEVMSLAGKTIDTAMSGIVSRIAFKGKGRPVVVFNTHSWERTDIVMVNGKSLAVYDEKGNLIPSQTNGSQVIFVAKIPPMGYRVYYIRNKNEIQETIPVFEDNNSITVDSDLLTATISKNSGCLAKLFHKETGKEMIFSSGDVIDYSRPFTDPGNLLQIFYEKPHGMSAWTIGPISRVENIFSGAKVEIVEKGPVRVVIRVEHKILQSTLTQDIVVYREIPRIDFYTTADWKEKGTAETDAPMLKVAFPLNFTQKEVCFEIPFGYIYRQTNGGECPQLKWMDVSDKGYGMSIMNNAKYGCSVLGNTMRLTLLRSAYDPDPVSDVGAHKFSYSLYPHKGDWRSAGTVQRGYEFNQPLLVCVADRLQTSDSRLQTPDIKRQDLPETHSFLSLEPSNLIVSALKQAEDGKGLILRFYEAHGKATKGTIRLNIPIKSAVETDLMERNLPGKKLKVTQDFSPARIKISVGKHEIKTIRLKIGTELK